MAREDLDFVLDVTKFKTRQPWGEDPYKAVPTQVKSAFTRCVSPPVSCTLFLDVCSSSTVSVCFIRHLPFCMSRFGTSFVCLAHNCFPRSAVVLVLQGRAGCWDTDLSAKLQYRLYRAYTMGYMLCV